VRDKGDGRQGSCPGKWRVRGKEGTGKGKGGRRKGGGDVKRGWEGKCHRIIVVCISWPLCLCLSQNQNHLTD